MTSWSRRSADGDDGDRARVVEVGRRQVGLQVRDGRRVSAPASFHCQRPPARRNFDVADAYAVCFGVDASPHFLAAAGQAESIRIEFVVTDDERAFQMVCGDLPARGEAARV